MSELPANIHERTPRNSNGFWNRQKLFFAVALLVGCVLVAAGLNVASTPDKAKLVSSQDKAFLGEVATALDDMGYEYEVGSQSISVNADEVDKIRIQLAQSDIIGAQEGMGYKLFDCTTLDMTTREFDLQHKRALEEEMATTLRLGYKYDRVKVSIHMQKETLFQEEEIPPSASVKISTPRTVGQVEVMGIQRLVASGVPGLEPQRVAVHDKDNNRLAGLTAEDDTQVATADSRSELVRQVQTNFEKEIAKKLERMVGPGNYRVKVDLEFAKETPVNVLRTLGQTSQTQVSGKTYTETGTSPSVGTEISDQIHNYVFSRTVTTTQGDVREIIDPGTGVEVSGKTYTETSKSANIQSESAVATTVQDTRTTMALSRARDAETTTTPLSRAH